MKKCKGCGGERPKYSGEFCSEGCRVGYESRKVVEFSDTVEGRLRRRMVERGEPVMGDGELVEYRGMGQGGRVKFLIDWQKRVGVYPSKGDCYARPHVE